MYRLPSDHVDGPERGVCTPRRPAWRAAILAAVAAGVIGCDDPAGSPGPLVATLVSPNGAEGAARFELPVDGVTLLKVRSGVALEALRNGRRQIVVVLREPGAIALELTVADQTRPPEVKVVEVVGPDDRARTLTGYRVQVQVAP